MHSLCVFLLMALILMIGCVGCGNMSNPVQPASGVSSSRVSLDATSSNEELPETTVIFNPGFGRGIQPSGGLVNPLASLPGDAGDDPKDQDQGEILPDEITDPFGEGGDDTAPPPDAIEDGNPEPAEGGGTVVASAHVGVGGGVAVLDNDTSTPVPDVIVDPEPVDDRNADPQHKVEDADDDDGDFFADDVVE